MNSIEEVLPLLEPIVKGIAEHFGKQCEVVLHDYQKDFSSSIVAIANGQLTGRSIGKGGTKIGLRIMQGDQKEDGLFHYTTQTKQGKLLHSSTMYLKNDAGEVIGSLCINYDMTDLMNLKSAINHVMGPMDVAPEPYNPIVFSDVEDMLIALIKESIDQIGVPVSIMTRAQKREGIQYLNQRGAFKIKNSTNIVAEYYNISRFTVYNYLNDEDVEE
jgi:predicted transcriptional regulator YheO